MPGTTNDLHGVLDDYKKFLREKDLAPAAQQPCLVRWVREFLLFALPHPLHPCRTQPGAYRRTGQHPAAPNSPKQWN